MPFTFGFDPLFGLLQNVIGWLVSALQLIFVFLFNILRAVFEFLWASILIVVRFILAMLGHVRNFFTALWERVVKRGVLKLVELYATLREKLVKIFGPVLRILHRIRKWIDDHILPVMLRYLNLIQRIRQVLVVFRILGFKWAKRLDERLAQTDGEISRAFNLVRAKLNEISTILNLILDPALILRENVIVGSVVRGLDALLKGITGRGIGHYIQLPNFLGATAVFKGKISDVRAEMLDSLPSGAGQYGQVAKQAAQAWADFDRELR